MNLRELFYALMLYIAVPGVVLDLKTKAFNTSLHVTWERPDSPNGDIVAYQVKWRKTEETTESSVCLSSSGVQINGVIFSLESLQKLVIINKKMNKNLVLCCSYTSVHNFNTVHEKC